MYQEFRRQVMQVSIIQVVCGVLEVYIKCHVLGFNIWVGLDGGEAYSG